MNLITSMIFFVPIASVITAYQISNTSGKVIVLILFVGSIFAWSIMLTKFIELKTAMEETRRFLSAYNNETHPLALFLGRKKYPLSPLFRLYGSVCKHVGRFLNFNESNTHKILLSNIQDAKYLLKESNMRAIRSLANQIQSEQALELEKYMRFLATAVTAAPFLGLLGTVWGVMDAFGGLAFTSSATLAAVAPGVSGALLTTVVGLVVALPSSVGYNILAGRIQQMNVSMERFLQELMADMERVFLA